MDKDCYRDCPLILQLCARVDRLEKDRDAENAKKWRIMWILLYAVLTVAGIKVADALIKDYTISDMPVAIICHTNEKDKLV